MSKINIYQGGIIAMEMSNDKKYNVNVPIPIARGEIYVKPPSLVRRSISDCEIDILIALMHMYLHRKDRDDVLHTDAHVEFRMSMYSLAKLIYAHPSGEAYKNIMLALKKLSSTVVCINTKQMLFSGSIVSFTFLKKTQRIIISVDKALLDMMYMFFCKVNLNVVLSLRGREKKIYIYLCSNNLIPVRGKGKQKVQVATINQLCGALNLPITRYNIYRIRNAISKLMSKKVLKFFSINDKGTIFYLIAE